MVFLAVRMTRRQVRYAHCYRCIYTWRTRNRVPRLCPRCKSAYWDVPRIEPVKMGDGLGVHEILLPVRNRILKLAGKFGAENVRVFGSVRRREAGPRSDVDLLVRWRAGSSLLDAARLRLELKKLLGREVDTVDERALHWALRPQVLSEAIPL